MGNTRVLTLSGRDIQVGIGLPGRRFALPWADESWRLWRDPACTTRPIPGVTAAERSASAAGASRSLAPDLLYTSSPFGEGRARGYWPASSKAISTTCQDFLVFFVS